MACRYTYQGKTFEAHEFDDVLKSLPPAVAAKYIPSIKSTPDAPFIGKDPKPIISLALKRMIRYAVDNGFDRIAMVTGEQSAERYDLSKQISKVEYLPHNSTLRAFDLGGNGVYDKVTEPDKIEDVIGKDAAKKLLESQPYTTGSGKAVHRLEGLDLKVGGEGMKAFYDKIVPNVANDVLKKLGGGKVGQTRITVPESRIKFEDRDKSAEERGLYPLVPSFDITDKMREQAAQGMPLFQRARQTRATLSTAEDGTPQIDGDGVSLAFAQPTERLEFFPADDAQKLYNFAIMGPGNKYLGYVEALFDNGRPTTLYDIQIEKQNRGTGAATAAVKALLDSAVDGKLDISNIVPSAQGFWERLGIGRQNLEDGATYGDTITRESFGASPAGKNAGTDSGGARIAESQDRRAITAKRNPALSTPPETTALLRRLSVLESIRTCLG